MNTDFQSRKSLFTRLPSFGSRYLAIATVLGCWTAISYGAEPNSPEQNSTRVLFEREVEASLTKLGCNAGTCHGSLHGKGGFRLSLRGQDPELDFHSIAIDLQGRRIDLLDSPQSLLLAKPSGAVAHQGGVRMQADSIYYQAIRSWLDQGAIPPQTTEDRSANLESAPKLVTLRLTPDEAWISLPTNREDESSINPLQTNLRATAEWSDGTTTDVTPWCKFECSSIQGAQVDGTGTVTVDRAIDTTVSAFYLGKHASSRLVFVEPKQSSAEPSADRSQTSLQVEYNSIDSWVNRRLSKLGIEPQPAAAPELLVRRLYLTAVGRLPTIDEQDAFLSDAPDQRVHLCIDRLLADPQFASMWALKWSDLLRNEPKVMSEKGVSQWHAWLARSISADKPVHEMVMEMLTSVGSTYETPPASFHRTHREPTVAAESVGQVFLGIRMQCAKCHNHPFDVWTQDDYYGLAAFFTPIERKQIDNMPGDKLDSHVITGDEIISLNPKNAAIFHPGRSKWISAKSLTESIQASDPNANRPEADQPLERLANWIGNNNRQFARNMANRIWAHTMGKGIVDPPDDFRSSNPPSNPELLEFITDQFIQHNYSTQWLTREILSSQTFARESVEPLENHEAFQTARDNFAGFPSRRMTAEVLHDSILDLTGSVPRLKHRDKSSDEEEDRSRFRAVQFPSVPNKHVFLKAFGKPERLLDCECERSGDLSLRQSLLLVNDEQIRNQLRDKRGNIAQWVKAIATSETDSRESWDAVIVRMYRMGLCRQPSNSEWQAIHALYNEHAKPSDVLEDVAWAIINSKEFLFLR